MAIHPEVIAAYSAGYARQICNYQLPCLEDAWTQGLVDAEQNENADPGQFSEDFLCAACAQHLSAATSAPAAHPASDTPAPPHPPQKTAEPEA